MDKLKNTLKFSTEFDSYLFFTSIFLCILTSFLIKFVYIKKSKSLSNKDQVASLLPLLSLITFIVISVVKSSLALSLGLVGALSVVRFRTPIKEPEDLVYIFFAMVMGIGYASGQLFVTTCAFFITLILIWFASKDNKNKSNDYNIIIETNPGSSSENINKLSSIIKGVLDYSYFLKYEKISEEKEIFVFKGSLTSLEQIDKLKKELDSKIKKYQLHIFEVNVLN